MQLWTWDWVRKIHAESRSRKRSEVRSRVQSSVHRNFAFRLEPLSWKMRKELIFTCRMIYKRISNLRIILFLAQYGVHDETNKNFNCLCWIGQGSLCLQVMIPCSGYVPGQIITTTLHYTSTPNIPLRKLSTKLLRVCDGWRYQFLQCRGTISFRLFSFFLQIAHFRTSTNSMVHKKVLKKTRHSPPFPAHGRVASELLIPPIAPSDLQYCGIIDLEYELVVSVHVSGP